MRKTAGAGRGEKYKIKEKNMKKRKKKQHFLSWFLAVVLIVAMALVTAGCGDSGSAGSSAIQAGAEDEVHILGEGSRSFLFSVVNQEGEETKYEIHTDQEMVGQALLDLGLIDGETGELGIYVKVVDGITADYDTDGVYWAFYVNGEYWMTGVDMTEIVEGDTYSFRIEK